jgi:hypothetical protein
MFNVRSPDGRFNDAFSAYAYHTSQLDEFAERLAEEDDPNDVWVQARIACDLDINLVRLTDNEIKYIEEEVAMRR